MHRKPTQWGLREFPAPGPNSLPGLDPGPQNLFIKVAGEHLQEARARNEGKSWPYLRLLQGAGGGRISCAGLDPSQEHRVFSKPCVREPPGGSRARRKKKLAKPPTFLKTGGVKIPYAGLNSKPEIPNA